MAKIYAVKKGLVPGIYHSWKECEQNVKGYSGAVYKSFESEAAAKEFLGITNEDSLSKQKVRKKRNSKKLIAYVDGSFNENTKQYGYGIVLIIDKNEIKLSGFGADPSLSAIRNVAGELLGSEQAILFAVNNGYNEIEIHHDYEGISKWCTREWDAKNKITQSYRDFYDKHLEQISINFIKVKAHSNDKYNEIADVLAKSNIFD